MATKGPRANGRRVSISRLCSSSSTVSRQWSSNGRGRCPAPTSTGGQAGGRYRGQQCQCAGVGLVGLDAAPIEQPHVGQRTEQRSPVGAGHALFQAIDVADEHRDAAALVGDDVELLQALLVTPEGQASKELLDGGVPRPDRQEDQIAWSSPTQASAITSGHSSMRYSVVEEGFAGMVVSSDKREQQRRWGNCCPWVVGQTPWFRPSAS